MSNIIDKITSEQINPSIPEFKVGYTVRVNVKIVEGKRQRIQAFEGVVIARKGSGVGETFTVRKKSFGVGVERIFPVNSPVIGSIEIIKRGRVRRAKLNFLREKVGQYRIKEEN